MRAARISVVAASFLSGCAYLPTVEIGTASVPAPIPLMAAQPVIVPPVAAAEPVLERPVAIQTTPLAAAALAAAPKAPRPRGPGEAATRATQTAMGAQYDGATAVFDYAVGGLYQVITAFNRVTIIALQPGEKFLDATGGDTVRFKLEQQSGGDREYIIVKPTRAGLQTNIFLTTDRHEYTLDITSVETDKPFNARVAWNYPQELAKFQIARKQSQQEIEQRETPIGVDPSRLDFSYAIETLSGTPAWVPTQVFTDGRQTWIQFRPDLGAIEAPVLFVPGPDGNAQVNYAVKGNFFVVQRALTVAELVLGRDPQERVRITRQVRP